MSQILASPFRKTLVAVAVVALSSGCATTADGPGHGGGLGDSIARVGEKTASFGQTVWQRTGFMLGLHDDPGVPLPGEPVAAEPESAVAELDRPAARPAAAPSAVPVAKLPLHLDEVDLALMEEDAMMPGTAAPSAGAPAGPASLLGDDDLLAGTDSLDAMDVLPFEDTAPAEILAATGPDPFDPLGLDAMSRAEPELAASTPAVQAAPIARDTLAAPAPAPTDVVAASDLEHRVGEAETLWDIAKMTTGDATNWHTLADVNDLGPGASVYPGQVLTIPADMLRPELAGGAALAAAPAAEAPAAIEPAAEPTVAAAPAERLSIPAGASPVATPVTAPADGAREFAIAAGETLWDFAKRTTGDATNWQAIATQNGFDEKAAVAVYEGQRIFVPSDMVVDRGATVAAAPTLEAVPTESAEPVADADAFVPIPSVGDTRTVGESVDASASALADAAGAGASDAAPEKADMRIVEAAFTGGPAADLPEPGAAGGTDSVMISGTYYPKAIYSGADFSAGLLMRVSPGTRLTVSRVDGKWYEVETERGTGWVHERDIK